MARTPDIGETRGRYLRVRLAKSEEDRLDTNRGSQSRSEFVRSLINQSDNICTDPGHRTGRG